MREEKHIRGKVEINPRASLNIQMVTGDMTNIACCGGYTDSRRDPEELRMEQEDNARRIVALWNVADEIGLTTEEIVGGRIQNACAYSYVDTMLKEGGKK